jgi:hypothetical protein
MELRKSNVKCYALGTGIQRNDGIFFNGWNCFCRWEGYWKDAGNQSKSYDLQLYTFDGLRRAWSIGKHDLRCIMTCKHACIGEHMMGRELV